MKKDYIFFSPDGQGLTMTSANHIANLAKEMIRGIETQLEAMVLYSTSVSLIGTDGSDELVKGNTREELEETPAKLHAVAKAKSLIAWLREAIKAKERLIREVETLTLDEYAKLMDITLPTPPKADTPLDADQYFASLSLDERNRYYETETLAAVLGKAIHPGGSFAEAREDLDRRIQTPRDVRGDGRDTLIYSYRPTVATESVDDLYFRLQKQYREAQAKVNASKFECERAVKESEIACDAKYTEELAAYNQELSLLNARLSTYRKERIKEISAYRIAVPQSLRDIFDKVSHLGKQ
ncbi:MAG: hypothetical protein K2H94_00880 [Duncaniella sp.]|nr:hypothetical protein [Duncaniella sp.]